MLLGTKHFVLCVLTLFVAVTSTHADDYTFEFKNTIRACAEADVSAIFGGRAQACLIYNLGSQETEVFIRACAGLRIAAGLNMVLGGDIKGSILFCPEIRLKFKNRTPGLGDILKALQDKDNENTKKLYKEMEQSLRTQLNMLSDDQLKQLGIDREDIDKLKFTGFGSFHDQSGEKAIKKRVESLKIVSNKPGA